MDSLKVIGSLELTLRDSNNRVKERRQVHNLVVQGGRELIASQLAEGEIGKPSHMAVGSGESIPDLSQSTLDNELARVALKSTTRSTNTVTYECEFGPTIGTGEITESGIFNGDSAGVMLNRATFGVITKESADTLTIKWNLSIN